MSLESFLANMISTSVQQVFNKYNNNRDALARQPDGNHIPKRLSCPELTRMSTNSKKPNDSKQNKHLTVGDNYRAKRRVSNPVNFSRFNIIDERSDAESSDNSESPTLICTRRRSSFFIGTRFEKASTDDEESESDDRPASESAYVSGSSGRSSSIIDNSFNKSSEVEHELPKRRSSTLTIVNDDSFEDTFNCSATQPERSLNILVSLLNGENGIKGLTDAEIISLVEAKVSR